MRLLATLPVMYAAKAPAVSAALHCSARYDNVSAKAVDMNSPCSTRRKAKAPRPGACARSTVGSASAASATITPRRRSMRRLKKATARLPIAMPSVAALTASPIAAGRTPYAAASEGRIACVAKRSTSVRNAVVAISAVRAATRMSHHLFVHLVGDREEVHRDQLGGHAAVVLPPVRSAVLLRRDVARLVHDRHRAAARILHDLAADDVDHRRPLVMAVPGNDAAGLDVELAQAEKAPVQGHRLLRQIGARAHHIGDAFGAVAHHRLAFAIGHALVRWALAGERRHGKDCRNGGRDLHCFHGFTPQGWSMGSPAAFDRQHRAGDGS